METSVTFFIVFNLRKQIMVNKDPNHQHIYDAEGKMICCTQEEKINHVADKQIKKEHKEVGCCSTEMPFAKHAKGDGHNHEVEHSDDDGHDHSGGANHLSNVSSPHH